MHGIKSLDLSETKDMAGGFLLNQHEESPHQLITDGMEPHVSTVLTAAIQPSGDAPIRGDRRRGDGPAAGDTGSRTTAQRPRSPLFRLR